MTQKIKVLTNKKNAGVKISCCSLTEIFKVAEYDKCYYIEFSSYNKLSKKYDFKRWRFNSARERNRIYEKIKPYFEFKEVEEIEID